MAKGHMKPLKEKKKPKQDKNKKKRGATLSPFATELDQMKSAHPYDKLKG